MNIGPSNAAPTLTKAPLKVEAEYDFARLKNKKSEQKDDDSFWKNRADELRELLLFIDQEKLEDAGKIIKGIGDGLKGAWKEIVDVPKKLLDLPIIKDQVDEEKQRELVDLAATVGRIAGFTAVGGHALGGALKVASGHQQKDTSRKLDGIMDMATAAALGATVAGLPGARAVLAPLAAGFNIFRGGYNAGHGFKTNDGRKQLQGALDAVRSAGSVGRLLKSSGAFFNVAGVALAPIAGAVQAGRGLHDLANGLRNENNKKELEGLVDIATAVGTALAFASGVAIIPGVALAVVANVAKVAYELSPKVRKKMDPLIDKMEPKLQKFVDKSEKITGPVRRAWKKLMSKIVKQQESSGFGRYSRAQLAEISQLLHIDGDYTRQEERRLKTHLEHIGQGQQTPKRDEEPAPIERTALKKELQTREQRVEFLRFMLVVAYFDNEEKDSEASYLDAMASALDVPAEEMAKLREERRELDVALVVPTTPLSGLLRKSRSHDADGD